MLKSRSRFVVVLIPTFFAILYLVTAFFKIRNSSYSATSDVFVRFLPYIGIGIGVIIFFFIVRNITTIKVSSILTIILTLVLSIFNVATTPTGRLKAILEPLRSASSADEPIVVLDDTLLTEAEIYNSNNHQIVSTPPMDTEAFWLLSYLPDSTPISPYKDYTIADEISTPFYLAIRLEKATPSSSEAS